MTEAQEPGPHQDDRELLLAYLDYYRTAIVAAVEGIPEAAAHESQLPSGWTPAGLLNHLIHMERRWLVWGFRAEQVPAPHGDAADDGGWVRPVGTLADLSRDLLELAPETRQIVLSHRLTDRAAIGGRFPDEHHFPDPEQPPDLHWILVHVLQEYARHAGHLDIVCELHAARKAGPGA